MSDNQEELEKLRAKLEEALNIVHKLSNGVEAAKKSKEVGLTGAKGDFIPNKGGLCKRLSCDENQLEEVYDFTVPPFTICLLGEITPQKAVQGAYLVLLGFKFLLGQNVVSASKIKDILTNSDLKVPTDFGARLTAESGIGRKGKAKSPKAEYYLKRPGEVEAVKIFKGLLGKKTT